MKPKLSRALINGIGRVMDRMNGAERGCGVRTHVCVERRTFELMVSWMIRHGDWTRPERPTENTHD